MKSAEAKKFAEVTFNPAFVGDYGRVKNLFVGFPQTPVKGEAIALSEITEGFDYDIFHDQIKERYPACVRLIEHLHDNVADGNVLAFAQLLAWCSEIITQPEINPGFCVILRGKELGTGKTTISDVMRDVLGERYHFKATKSDQIIGRFNSHMMDKLLISGEEMSWGGNRDLSAQLKDMITGDSHAVELKGVDIQQMPKYFRMMLVTNEDWVFNASKDERRALIFDVNPAQAQNKEYFEPLYASKGKLKPEMIEQFRNMLASIDTTGINMMKPVETDGLRSQIAESLNPMEQWWLTVIDNGDFGDEDPFNCSTKLEGRISKAFIHKNYLDWLDKHKPNSSERITGARAFGVRFVRMIGKQFVHTDQKVRLSNLKMVNAYDFHRPKEMIEENKKAFGM
jgi:phage/plasmid-associated DNA primase